MAVSFPQSREAIKAGLSAAMATVFPHQCCACASRVEPPGGLCPACWAETRFLSGHSCDACGVPLPGVGDGTADQCDDCMARPRPWARGRAALDYAGAGRRLVLALKHGDRDDVAIPAARWMTAAGRDLLVPGRVLVPVPLHPFRLIRRRYNQAALLAGRIAAATGLTHVPDALVRVRRTPPTEGMTRDERFAAMAGTIAVAPRYSARLKDARVVIVDDVMTSGATLSAAAESLYAAGAEQVDVLVMARALKAPYLSKASPGPSEP